MVLSSMLKMAFFDLGRFWRCDFIDWKMFRVAFGFVSSCWWTLSGLDIVVLGAYGGYDDGCSLGLVR
jgi:hypothetical protein